MRDKKLLTKNVPPPAFVESELQRTGMDLKHASGHVMMLCPFHRDYKTPSLSVSVSSSKVPPGVFHCFAGNTVVITDKGTYKIKSLLDKTVKVLDGNGDWVDTEFESYGIHRLYKLVLSKDNHIKTIFATSNHGWFVHGEKKPVYTQDLEFGSSLVSVYPREATLSKRKSVHHKSEWKVVSVEKTQRVEEVYCCNVPTTHSFVLEDFILTSNCFGCGAKGSWNTLAKHLGLRLWNANDEDIETTFVFKSNKKIKEELVSEGHIFKKLSNSLKWKSYDKDFLINFDARLLYDERCKATYLYLPMYYLNNVYGYCKVKLNKEDPGPKYWFNAGIRKPLYPIDYIIEKNHTQCVCLVEGIADAFRCIKNGIPALALLGTELTSFMSSQLEILAIPNIILCLDGDAAGIGAMKGTKFKEGLYKKLTKLGYAVKIAIPPDGSDPDSMPIKYINKLGKLCEKFGGPTYTNQKEVISES